MTPQNIEPEILDIRVLHDPESMSTTTSPLETQVLPTDLAKHQGSPRVRLLDDELPTNGHQDHLITAEEQILRDHSIDIVKMMGFGSDDHTTSHPTVMELGAGPFRKTPHLLLALAKAVQPSEPSPPVQYYALNPDRNKLVQTLNEVNNCFSQQLQNRVTVAGIWGTYDGGIAFVKNGGLSSEAIAKAKLPQAGVVGRSTEPCDGGKREPSRRSTSQSPSRSSVSDSPSSAPSSIFQSQNDSQLSPSLKTDTSRSTSPTSPVTKDDSNPLHILFSGASIGRFSRSKAVDFLRGLPLHPGRGGTVLFGIGHRSDNPDGCRLNKTEQDENAIEMPNNKYSTTEAYALFEATDLRPIHRWKDTTEQYSIWLLERPKISFRRIRTPAPLRSEVDPGEQLSPAIFRELDQIESFSVVPTLEEWSKLWSLWDTITLSMIPESMLHDKPIHLRHKCLFYLGHIPTFLDIQLSRTLKEPHTEPVYFKDMFERGIDPHVDDPTQCHDHSAVPENDEDWPTREEIISFRDRVRARLTHVYEVHGKDVPGTAIKHFPISLGRILWMGYEHECFHTETLLFMLIQRAGTPGGTLPPPGFAPPVWSVLAKGKAWSEDVGSIPTVTIGPTTITVGIDNMESNDVHGGTTEDVQEFGWDNESPRRNLDVAHARIETLPVLNGQYHRFWLTNRENSALPFPSLWVEDGGEIKVRTLYGPVSLDIAKNWPFIGSYDELNAFAKSKDGRLPTEAELTLFRNQYEGAEESNYGFRNWHLIPPVAAKDGHRGHNGGVWEWTSTLWDSYEGFQASVIYPGFSADFFDGLHQVVLGASYANVPRHAQRRSLRDWYQHNYPYSWVGGRVVYDVAS